MKTEANKLQEVAEQYTHHGYAVIVEPSASQVPEFMDGFQPDMLAYKNDEKVVVEVRVKNQIADANTVYMAGLINSQPGWRFDLFVVNDSRWPDDVLTTAYEKSPDGIVEMARNANELDSSGQPEAACLLAWAATEASLRNLAKRHGVRVERYSPVSLIQTLYSAGLLSLEQYDHLREILKVRNAVAHGLNTYGSAINGSVGFLVGLSQDLLVA